MQSNPRSEVAGELWTKFVQGYCRASGLYTGVLLGVLQPEFIRDDREDPGLVVDWRIPPSFNLMAADLSWSDSPDPTDPPSSSAAAISISASPPGSGVALVSSVTVSCCNSSRGL